MIDDDGDVIQFGGAPNFGFSVDPTQARFNSIVLKEGDWPAAGDVAVDTSTASKEDIEVGEEIGVQAKGAVRRLRVSGLFDFSAEGNIGGATLAAFDLPTAQQIFKKEGRLDQIRAAAARERRRRSCSRRSESVLPPGTQVRTGEGQASEDASETQSFLTLPPGLPARVRRHRALRGRVRDRELALDHDRAAHAGVRHPAHDRRLTAPDHEGGAARGARHRHPRLRSSASCSASASRRASSGSSSRSGSRCPTAACCWRRER